MLSINTDCENTVIAEIIGVICKNINKAKYLLESLKIFGIHFYKTKFYCRKLFNELRVLLPRRYLLI